MIYSKFAMMLSNAIKLNRVISGAFPSLRSTFSSSSSLMKKEMQVVSLLKGIVDPITNRAIQNMGILQSIKLNENGFIDIKLDYFIPGYPYQTQIEDEIRSRLSGVEWTNGVRFLVETPKSCASLNSVSLLETTLSKVGHIIGVSSCKGGVGKSTVAVNLAIMLSKMGLKVGILDADIYGPSLPLLLHEQNSEVLRSPKNPKHVLPLHAACAPELKMLSFGHVNPKSGAPGSGGKSAAVVRGPIASRILNQLLLATEWGELDYLVVDMPPGTGDLQITLSQSACLSGAVIVTTPHRLSLADAAKGVAMFEDLKVPTLAVVENMAHFTCEHGSKYHIFGRGGRENLLRGCQDLNHDSSAETLDAVTANSCSKKGTHTHDESCAPVPSALTGSSQLPSASFLRLQNCPMHSLPIVSDHNTADNVHLPISIAEPFSESAEVFRALARDVLVEVFRSHVGALLVPSISFDAYKGQVVLKYFGASRTMEFAIPAAELRMRDPMTGKRHLSQNKDFKGIFPEKFEQKGNYGVAVVWNDGHFADIYPYDVLRFIAEDVLLQRNEHKI